MDASPASLELAARLLPRRASRSASRISTADAVAISAVPTTATAPPVVITAAVHRAATATAAKPTTKTTVHRHSTTTTTRKPRSTTTTTKPAPKPAEPPPMRPFTPPTAAPSTGQSETGEATWYKSSDPAECAHKTLPIGTVVTVVNLENNKTTTCKVGDRGPYVEGRIIDLSPEAFSQLAPLSEGVLNVRIEW
jgi:rare lipoprotein A (peptidoglycan hydrolase)